jgi:hypothetical protein
MNTRAIINNQVWMAFAEERQKVLAELKKRNLETALTATKNHDNFIGNDNNCRNLPAFVTY